MTVVDPNGTILDQLSAAGAPPNGAFSTLLPAGNGSGTAFPGAVTIPNFTVVAGQNTNLDPISLDTGDLQVNFTYLGFPVSGTGVNYRLVGILLTLSGQFANGGSISGGNDALQMSQIPIGDYNFHVGFFGNPLGPLVPVTISTAQTTVIDIELSDTYGQVIGTLLVNGQPGGSVSLAVVDSNGLLLDQISASSTPPDGVFTALLPAGNGSGSAFPGGVSIPGFTIVAAQTTNLGGVLGNTQAGSDVLVQPAAVDENGNPTGASPINFVFDQVTLPGETTVMITQGGPGPSEGFKLGTPATYFVLETDAEFSGSVEVCIDYSTIQFGNESKLELQHFADTDGDDIADDWVNITVSLDAGNDFICGTTESFSFFAIVEPDNQPPALISSNAVVEVGEGAVALNSGSFSDPDGDDLILSASLGAIAVSGPGTWGWSLQTTDGPAQAQVIIKADDGNGGMAMIPFDLTVNNVPPDGLLSAPSTVSEGSGYNLSFAAVADPSIADTAAGFSFAFDCGDGSGTSVFSSISAVACPGADDDGVRTVAGQVQDKDAGVTPILANVEIVNVAPVITNVTGPSDPLARGTMATVVVDYDDPGLGDTHECEFSWDDDPDAPTTTTAVGGGSGTGQCSSTFAYDAAGVFTVSVTVTDDDGGSDSAVFEFVVVYDPAAGFVTGGGFIDSPYGAYVPDPAAVGKANFGFVARYKKGQTVPDGQTQFQFKAGDLDFHSATYQFLVVAGHRAMFKGDGTINGSGDYGFLLTAEDGDIVPSGPEADKFRIKIWDKLAGDTVVYDNNVGASDDIDAADPQEIGGGSIVIHSGGKK